MLDLVDVLDSSGNENNNMPSLQLITDSLDDEVYLYVNYWPPQASGNSSSDMEQYSSKPVLLNILDDNVLSGDDNFDAEANFGDFCDEGGVDLVMDTRDEAYTKRFTCAMLVNATQITEGVETELYNWDPHTT